MRLYFVAKVLICIHPLNFTLKSFKIKQAVMRGPTRVFLSQNGQFWTDSTRNGQFSTFLHSLRLEFMQKIREIQYVVFEQMRKTFDFGNFWPFWPYFWTDTTQNDQFSSFPEKNKNVTFLHSLRLVFMEKIGEIQCAVF